MMSSMRQWILWLFHINMSAAEDCGRSAGGVAHKGLRGEWWSMGGG